MVAENGPPSTKLNLRSFVEVFLFMRPRTPRYNDENGSDIFLGDSGLGFHHCFLGRGAGKGQLYGIPESEVKFSRGLTVRT